jgi:hypothetical protein
MSLYFIALACDDQYTDALVPEEYSLHIMPNHYQRAQNGDLELPPYVNYLF